MRYRLIIQELKKSTDQNVRAFINDVEGMKRLTSEQRQHYLANLQEREAISLLVKDFIPYIIRVAYANSWKSNVLSVLDLVNEGIISAYTGLEKSYRGKKDAVRLTRVYIQNHISKMLSNNGSLISSGVNPDHYCSVDSDFIKTLDYAKKRALLSNLLTAKIGERDGQIIIDFFSDKDADIKALSKKYGVSCERIRQVARNFSQLYKKVDNLWELFSSDFDLPVNEARFYRDYPCRKNCHIFINNLNH